MSDGAGARSRTRSNTDSDELLIQKVVERILSNKSFLDKLLKQVSESLSAVKSDVKALDTKVSSLTNEVYDTMDALEQYSRGNNLRIYGMQEEKNEVLMEKIIDLCHTKLKIEISSSDIDVCHRLSGREGASRPVIVRFCRRSVRNSIFYNKAKLKGTKFIVREDLTRKRFALVTDLIKKTSRNSVYTVSGNICVKINNTIHKLKHLSDYNVLLDNIGRIQ